jgi:hypothetical protein
MIGGTRKPLNDRDGPLDNTVDAVFMSLLNDKDDVEPAPASSAEAAELPSHLTTQQSL